MPEAEANTGSLADAPKWQGKVSNVHQLGGIETAVLDNGAGRGSRIAWINTGGGLRFKVVLDRAMDIADAFHHQHSLAWISHLGITPPNPSEIYGAEWLNSFGGGLLTTCGLTHVGGPEEDAFGARGLHDRISQVPAEIESIIQPNLNADQPKMSITGRMLQSSTFGPHLELKRTISAVLGQAKVYIHDEVTNLGNTPAPHMLLYHMNFGWPLVDEGAAILWEGEWQARDEESSGIFNENNNFKQCSGPITAHQNAGEAAAYIDIESDQEGWCSCGIKNREIGVHAKLRFPKKQLPWLTNWQHWGSNEYVMALEPGTHPPVGQAKAREQDTLIQIGVGESRSYDLELSLTNN